MNPTPGSLVTQPQETGKTGLNPTREDKPQLQDQKVSNGNTKTTSTKSTKKSLHLNGKVHNWQSKETNTVMNVFHVTQCIQQNSFAQNSMTRKTRESKTPVKGL